MPDPTMPLQHPRPPATGLGSISTILTFGQLAYPMQDESFAAGVSQPNLRYRKAARPGGRTLLCAECRRRLGRRRSTRGEAIDAPLAGQELEPVGDVEHGLGAPQEQEPVIGHQP